MSDFASLLSRSIGTSEPPKPVPAGSWYVLIKAREFGKTEKKQTPFLRLTLALQQPGPDVDAQALAAFGDYSGKTIRDDHYITEDSLWRLDKFIQDVLGITGMTIAQACENLTGKGFVAVIRHRANPQDLTQVFAEVGDRLKPAA